MAKPPLPRLLLRTLYRLQQRIRGQIHNATSKAGKVEEGGILVCLGTLNHVRAFRPVLDRLPTEDITLLVFYGQVHDEMGRQGLDFLKGEAFIPTAGLGADDFLPTALKEAVKHFKPRLLVAMNSAFDSIGQERNIPTLIIRHGLLVDHPAHIQDVKHSHIACLGNLDRDLLEKKASIPSRRLHVTGFSRFDALLGQEFNRKELLHKYELSPSEKHILVVTQPHQNPWDLSPEEAKGFLVSVLKAGVELGKEGQKVCLIIKTHPREDPGFHKGLVEETGSSARVFSDAQASLQEICFLSDVMVTSFSTAGLEALLMNKPLVTVNFGGDKEPIPFHEKGGSLGVISEEELLPALQQALRGKTGKDVEGFLQQALGEQDRGASERIAKLIRSLAGP